MNLRFLRNSLSLHKWVGIVCLIFVLILSISGILLMHRDTLHLDQSFIDGKYIPKKYFVVKEVDSQIQALAIGNSKTIYSGTNNGISRSQDGGKTWLELNLGLLNRNVHALAINPNAPNIIYAGTALGIFKSEDSGDHWSEWFDQSTGLTDTFINDLAIPHDQPDSIYAATQGGLFISGDGGASWSHIFVGKVSDGSQEGIDIHTVRISPQNSTVIYASTDHEIFKSTDKGKTWKGIWDKSAVHGLFAIDEDQGTLFAATSVGLYKTVDGGVSWNTSSQFSPSNQILKVWSASTDIIISTPEGFFRTTDKGQHWLRMDLSRLSNTVPPENFKMDLVKFFTEMHTGRLFGDSFYILVDAATIGLLLLAFSGMLILYSRARIAAGQLHADEQKLDTDNLIYIQETADDLASESQHIHDMIEHIQMHLEKCKSIYMKQDDKEMGEITHHIATLDEKIHLLMSRIEELEKFPDAILRETPATPKAHNDKKA